jgi:Zn-finger nucleic acid-binding protein
MNCPACNQTLAPAQVGGITVDVCQNGCGGLWFDVFELNKIHAATQFGADNPLVVQRDAMVQVDHTKKRLCPRCQNQPMMRRYSSRKRAVEIDECPACGGHWLDYGELELIQAELKGQAIVEPNARAITVGQVKSYFGSLRQEAGR